MKTIFNMIGGGFQHAYSSCGWEHPKYIEWDRSNHVGNISIHIDGAVFDVPPDKTKLNIAWFCESPYFIRSCALKFDIPDIKQRVLTDFKYIFSNDKWLIKRHPEIKYLLPHAFPWVKDKKVFNKTKWVSIIASNKQDAPGHKLRHTIVNEYNGIVDTYGSGYKQIESKNEGLNDYMYSFAIENIIADGYFTEKVVDCFATGTIPIYWGDETISDYFLEDGIVRLKDNFDLSLYNDEFYESKEDVIKENFNRSINLPIPEDYIYLNYLK